METISVRRMAAMLRITKEAAATVVRQGRVRTVLPPGLVRRRVVLADVERLKAEYVGQLVGTTSNDGGSDL